MLHSPPTQQQFLKKLFPQFEASCVVIVRIDQLHAYRFVATSSGDGRKVKRWARSVSWLSANRVVTAVVYDDVLEIQRITLTNGCQCAHVHQGRAVPVKAENLQRIKALSHCAMFRATCPATPLREKLHQTLHSVTYLATAENVARQVAETVARSRTRFYFLQRFQATFGFVAQSRELFAKCERLCNV